MPRSAPSRVFRLRSSWCRTARLLALAAAAALVGSGAVHPGAFAQAANPAAQALQQANALFNQGSFANAAAAYEKLLKDYPTSNVVVEAQFQLADADYFAGKFDAATDTLRKFLASPLSQSQPDLLQEAAALLPEALVQQAAALPAEDAPARKSRYEEAVKEYSDFLAKFPKSTRLDEILYGRAVAYFQLRQFDSVVADLRRNLRDYGARETAGGSQYLLALALATQASQAVNAEPPRPADAARLYDESQHLLESIAAGDDLALANDAHFQLGEIFSARAAGAPDEKTRETLLQRALAAFRAVEPREPVIAAQTSRIETLKTRIRAAAAAGPGELRRVQAVLAREQGKLNQLQTRDDQALAARLRSAGVFYQIKRYDEARVLVQTLRPLATKPADEKLVLYYTAVTYACQHAADQAVAAYDKFQEKYRGDLIAENMPLVLGNMFLTLSKPDPARANQYFEEFATLYPHSRARETALTAQADALAQQGKVDEALAAFDNILKTHPKRELAAAAELGKARLLNNKGKLPEALAAFKKIRDTYSSLPEAAEAAFWVGAVTLQTNNAAAAVTELKDFLSKYPQHPLAPSAQLTLARAEQAAGDKSGAQAILASFPAKYPQSPEAPQSYFLRASIAFGEKDFAAMTKALTEFTEKYPDDPKLYDAYDAIAAVASSAQPPRPGEAIEAYESFLKKKPDARQAPSALLKIAALWKKTAADLGSYLVLGEQQRNVWKKCVDSSIAASERLLDQYQNSGAPVALAVANLLECQRLLISAKLTTVSDVAAYFQKLADKYKNSPAVHGRILFRAAALTMEHDPDKALSDMKAAYDPKVVYSPADLDQYTQALLKAKDARAAASVFKKLANDYPVPPGVAPAQAPADVQDAQATAIYGEAKLAELSGKQEAAADSYRKLKQSYPRSPKVSEANVGLARALIAKAKYDEALQLLSQVARSTNAPVDVRARGLLLTADAFRAKGDLQPAIDQYLKIPIFYPGAKEEAAQGLWDGGQQLEKQAAMLTDTSPDPKAPKKSTQLARASKAYEDLVSKYPQSELVAKAQARLAALPARH